MKVAVVLTVRGRDDKLAYPIPEGTVMCFLTAAGQDPTGKSEVCYLRDFLYFKKNKNKKYISI